MKKIIWWINGLPYRIKNSFICSFAILGFASTILSIIGFSLNDLTDSYIISSTIVFLSYVLIAFIIYLIIGFVYNNQIVININNMPVHIMTGDIYSSNGMRVIGCDNHFDTRVNDVVISKKSLHGQFLLKHCNISDVQCAIKNEARRLNLKKSNKGFYDFPLGAIVRYDNINEGVSYLLLSMTKLDDDHRAHITMSEYEQMLIKMWIEIDRVYASNAVVLPLLGSGISRFDDGLKNKKNIIKCMLCSLKNSGVSIKSEIRIIVDNSKDIPLYELREMLNAL